MTSMNLNQVITFVEEFVAFQKAAVAKKPRRKVTADQYMCARSVTERAWRAILKAKVITPRHQRLIDLLVECDFFHIDLRERVETALERDRSDKRRAWKKRSAPPSANDLDDDLDDMDARYRRELRQYGVPR